MRACVSRSSLCTRREEESRERESTIEEKEELSKVRERERDGSERPQNICCMLVDARLQRARGRTEIIVPTPATDRVKRKKRRT